MPNAEWIQALMARTRVQEGGRVEIGGKSYPMTTRTLQPGERGFLPDGLENAEDSDLRVFCVTPTDFVSKDGSPDWPALNTRLTWLSETFTLIDVRPGDDVIGTTFMRLLLFAYKTPGGGTSALTVNAEQAQQDSIWDARTPADAAPAGLPWVFNPAGS